MSTAWADQIPPYSLSTAIGAAAASPWLGVASPEEKDRFLERIIVASQLLESPIKSDLLAKTSFFDGVAASGSHHHLNPSLRSPNAVRATNSVSATDSAAISGLIASQAAQQQAAAVVAAGGRVQPGTPGLVGGIVSLDPISTPIPQMTASSTPGSTPSPAMNSPSEPRSNQTNAQGGVEVSRKRQVRLLKNREAAKECRRKKKEYVKCLEQRVQTLESQCTRLIEELNTMKEMYERPGNVDASLLPGGASSPPHLAPAAATQGRTGEEASTNGPLVVGGGAGVSFGAHAQASSTASFMNPTSAAVSAANANSLLSALEIARATLSPFDAAAAAARLPAAVAVSIGAPSSSPTSAVLHNTAIPQAQAGGSPESTLSAAVNASMNGTI